MRQTVLEISDLCHSYGSVKTLNEVNLVIEKGQIACLLGPSGCGKTTLLRCIAGFETVEQGVITINKRLVSSSSRYVPPEERRVGLVFQDYALFPHLTAKENVGFGIRQLPKEEIDEKVNHLLQSVDLDGVEDRYPNELSGGQQQRVALARALAPEPELLLLDEPFSNLDSGLREKMKHELKALLRHFGVTAVMVTHNQNEAFDIADRIAVMNRGRILQWGTSYDLYHEPEDKFVAQFLIIGTFIQGIIIDKMSIQTELGVIPVNGLIDMIKGERVSLLLRPDDIEHDDCSDFTATLDRVAFRGMYQVYYLSLPSGQQIHCFTSSHHHEHEIGNQIGIKPAIKHVVIFKEHRAIVMEHSELSH